MKSIKSVIKVVREWAQEICEEDDRRLFQRIDGVIADEERIYLHICDGNYFALESIDVRGGDGVQIFLTDIDHDKTCLYTLRECEDFEPIEYCMRGCPGSKFFTPDRLTELRRRIKDLLEIKEAKEKCKAESALSKIPNIPLEEYCTHKFPIRRKLILPTVETIDGKTVMHFKVDDLSERVIKKYHNKPSILIDAVDKELNSKNSMFNIFDQGTCRPSDEVLCYVIENMASRNPYGIKAAPDNARNYCSLAKILVLLNISSAELKDLSEEERDDMAEYLRRHDSLVAYGSGSSVNGIILALMHHIDKAERTLEHDVVVIDNSSVLQAAVKITQLVNMLINCDITLGWMKRHKSSELEIDDPTLTDKVAACFRK